MSRKHRIAEPALGHSIRAVYLAALAQGAVSVMLPASSALLRDRIGLSNTGYGALFLPWFGLAGLTAMAGHALLQRFSLRRLFLGGLAFQAVAMLLMAAAVLPPRTPGAILLVAAMACNGIGAGLQGIALNTAVVEIFPAVRASALAAMHGTLGIGAAVWPMLIAGASRIGAWALAPLVTSAAIWLLSFGASRDRLAGLGELIEPEHGRGDIPRRLWLWSATAFLYGVAEATFTAWVVLFLTDARGVRPTVAASALSAFWVAMTAGRFAGVALLRRVSARRLGVALSVAISASFVLVAGARTGVDAVWRFGAAGLACSMLFSILMASASADLPGRTPRVSAVFSAAILIGLIAGSFGIAPLRGPFGMERIYLVSAIGPLLVGWLLIRLGRS